MRRARGACVGRAGGSGAQQALGERACCRHAGRAGLAAGVAGARAAGRGNRRGRAQSARGRAGWAAGARPGRWARGLALGCALGALGPFSIRFDSVFFLSQLFGHCS